MKQIRRQKLFTALAVAAMLISSGSAIHAENTGNSGQTIYRLYNTSSGEHLYTPSTVERDACIRIGWMNEGVGWIGATEGDPVYRLYNPNAKGGDHYYTKDHNEATTLVSKGWKWDNNAQAVFYSAGKTPLYVAYNPNAQSGAHNYTVNRTEQDALMKAGWKYDEVAWNVISGPVSPKASDTKIETVKELGSMDRAPFPVNDDGWIIYQNGKIGFINKDGEVIAKPEYTYMEWARTTDGVAYDLYKKPGTAYDTPRNEIFTLPDNKREPLGGGVGGASGPDYWSFDPTNKALTYHHLADGNNKWVIYPWNKVPSQFTQNLMTLHAVRNGGLADSFMIWNRDREVVYGAFGQNDLKAWPQLNLDQKMDMKNPFWNANGGLFSPFEHVSLFEAGNGGYRRSYLYDPYTNKAIVSFDSISMLGMDGASGRIGKSVYVYDDEMNKVFEADLEDASLPIGELVPIKEKGTWKLARLDSVKKQIATTTQPAIEISDFRPVYSYQ